MEPIENAYFNWLCAKVMRMENTTPSLTFWQLLQQLHKQEFVYILAGDDNRAEDGMDLRTEFLRESNYDRDEQWLDIPCSVFEMLYAFARRAEFGSLLDYDVADWFWIFLNNLGIGHFNDAEYGLTAHTMIEDILQAFIWRTYEHDGVGGIFPLDYPDEDQRNVELWYQFAEYLQEHDPI